MTSPRGRATSPPVGETDAKRPVRAPPSLVRKIKELSHREAFPLTSVLSLRARKWCGGPILNADAFHSFRTGSGNTWRNVGAFRHDVTRWAGHVRDATRRSAQCSAAPSKRPSRCAAGFLSLWERIKVREWREPRSRRAHCAENPLHRNASSGRGCAIDSSAVSSFAGRNQLLAAFSILSAWKDDSRSSSMVPVTGIPRPNTPMTAAPPNYRRTVCALSDFGTTRSCGSSTGFSMQSFGSSRRRSRAGRDLVSRIRKRGLPPHWRFASVSPRRREVSRHIRRGGRTPFPRQPVWLRRQHRQSQSSGLFP